MKEKSQLKADMMLVAMTLCWGLSYVFMDICLEHMSPFMLNTYRFCIAFVLIAILFRKRVMKVNRITLKYSFLCAISLVVTYIGATYGVMHTTISNSGFLCAMTSIFTPLIAFIFLRQKQEFKLIIAVIVCFVGIAMLTLTSDFSINKQNLKGDLLCLLCAVAYAVNLLTVEKGVSTEGVDAFNLGTFQLGFVGIFNMAMVAMLGQWAMPPTKVIWKAVIFLAIFSTGVAFILQPIAQKHTTASHTGLIFALEPVFSAIAAAVIMNERLSFRNYIGAGLLLMSIVIMELDWGNILKRNYR